MKIIIFICGIFCAGCSIMNAQTKAVGINTVTPHPSAILDINSTNKAFLPPKVQLEDLASVTNPVSAPVEGLIVYNTGGVNFPGYYVWRNGSWHLMADFKNSAINMIIQNKATTAYLNGTTESTLTGGALAFTAIPGVAYTPSTGVIHLPAGKYSVRLVMNITAADESSTGALGVKKQAHLHSYSLKITNTAGTSEYAAGRPGDFVSDTSGEKKHSIISDFSISLPVSGDVVITLIQNTGHTTYSGTITSNDTFIHIQKIL